MKKSKILNIVICCILSLIILSSFSYIACNLISDKFKITIIRETNDYISVKSKAALTNFLFNKHYDIEQAIETFYKDFPSAKNNGDILEITENTILFDDKKSLKRFFKKDNYELVQDSQIKYTVPKKIAILYISTGRYIVFWDNFYKSMEKYFLTKHKKTYFLFTDHDGLDVPDNVVKIHQDQLPWPYITLKRYHFFDAIKDQLKEFDYIYFLNGNSQPVKNIDEEIFPTNEQGIMVTLHSWVYLNDKDNYNYDRNPLSQSYIPLGEGKFYVTGAFNGGTSKDFLKMTSIIKEWTDIDIKNNVMPLWHDESMLNKYLFTYFYNKNPLILFPEYVISEPFYYAARYEFPTYKMVLVDKNKEGGTDFLRGIKDNKDN